MVEQITRSSEKPRILKLGLEPSDEAYPMGHYLDEDAYSKEQDDFSKVRRYLSGRLISRLTFKSRAAHDQWEEQAGRPIQIHNSVKSIQASFDDTMLKGTIVGSDLTNLLSATRELMTLEALGRQREISKENNFYHEAFKPYEQPMIFDLCGNLLMKVKGLSILDIVRNKKISPADYYDCQINAFITKQCLNHDEVLSENRNQLTDLYPNKSRQLIEEGLGEILGITDLSPQLVEALFRFIAPKDPITSEVIQRVKDIVKQTNILEQRVFNAILNPNSEYFLPLKEMYEKYSNSDNPTIRLLALRKLGLREKNRIIIAYRKAKKLATENGEQGQFYDKLAETIRKVNIEESPLEVVTLTHNDIVMFLNGDSADSSASFEELRRLRVEILPRLSKDEYVINPAEVEWHGLIEPNSVSLKFDRDFQSRFKVTFHYENDKGEKIELNFNIDTKSKKESMDWDFLESPDAPEMQAMRNATMLSIKSALSSVLKQIKSEHQEKQTAKPVAVIPQPEETPTKKPGQKEAYVPREREGKQKVQKSTFVERALQEEIPRVENRIKSYIDNEDPNFEKLIKDLPDLIQGQIKKGVLDLRSGLTNKFKALPPMRHEGKLVHGLTIGDYRVLAVEAGSNGNGANGSEEKLHKFVAIQVQDRKDIYKKKNRRRYS